jgi:hypothetical protein
MKKLIIFLLAAIAVVSCKKTEEQADTASTTAEVKPKTIVIHDTIIVGNGVTSTADTLIRIDTIIQYD